MSRDEYRRLTCSGLVDLEPSHDRTPLAEQIREVYRARIEEDALFDLHIWANLLNARSDVQIYLHLRNEVNVATNSCSAVYGSGSV